jgi:hypothetical protein
VSAVTVIISPAFTVTVTVEVQPKLDDEVVIQEIDGTMLLLTNSEIVAGFAPVVL